MEKINVDFRETSDRTQNCTTCIHFYSYQQEYEDDLEPWDSGRCFETTAESVSVETICNLYKKLE